MKKEPSYKRKSSFLVEMSQNFDWSLFLRKNLQNLHRHSDTLVILVPLMNTGINIICF